MSTNGLSAGSPAGSFRFGEFTFDGESRQLLRNGEPRHLSPKAQQLLQVLLLARPRALSREELYDALWPATYVCDACTTTFLFARACNGRDTRPIRAGGGCVR